MSKLTHSQSNTNLIMLCPYMNRFANSSFSNSNRTFSSVSGLSNPSGLYGRTRSLIIKPLLSNAATISICSRCDSITTAADSNSNHQQHQQTTSSSNKDNHNENGQTTSTATANQGNPNDHNRTISNTFEQQEHHQDEEDHENYRHVEPAQPDNVSVSYSTAEHQPTLSTQTFSNNYHHNSQSQHLQQLHDPASLLSDLKPSTRPLSRRLSQHIIYPIIQQSSSQLHLNHHSSRHHAPPPPPPPPQPQEQQPKRHLNNPVIALIAHDLLKFMEEENHYRKARENLKSDVEKIRRSRHSSAVRHKNVNSSSSRQPTMTMNSNISNSSGVTYYTNNNSNKINNNVVSSSVSTSTSKPRARSSVPAFRNSYSNASIAKDHSFYYNTKPTSNNTSQSNNNNYHQHISKVAHTSKPAPPPVHASSSINTNELIDKLILQVYGQK